jgi:predicted secreted protein
MALDYHIGHLVRLSIAGSFVAHARDCSVNLSKETKKINHKDIDAGVESGGFSTAVGGVKSATGSCTAYLYKTGSSYAALFAAWKDDTEVAVAYGPGFRLSFQALITGLDLKATDGEVVEYTVNFESVEEIELTA